MLDWCRAIDQRSWYRVDTQHSGELKSVFWDSDKGYALHEVDLRDLSEGVYFLRYGFLGEEVVKRVVVVASL